MAFSEEDLEALEQLNNNVDLSRTAAGDEAAQAVQKQKVDVEKLAQQVENL